MVTIQHVKNRIPWLGLSLVLALALVGCTPAPAPTATPAATDVSVTATGTIAPTPTIEATETVTVTATATPAPVQQLPTETAQPALNSPISNNNIPLDTSFGIEMSQNIGPGRALSLVKAGGTRWIRRAAIPWRAVEPQEGQRNWAAISYLENEFKASTDQGFKTIVVVRETPAWAQAMAGRSCGPIKQDKLNAFGAFMHDLVARYSQPPYNVGYWEMWNEPDIDAQLVPVDSLWGCWGNNADDYYGGGYYAEMLKAVYPQVKAAQPAAQVLVGGLLLDCDPRNPPAGKDCKPARFLEGILKNGGGDFFDGVAFHAYDYYDNPIQGDYSHAGWHASASTTGPVVGVKAQFVRDLLVQYNQPGKFLMNTEMALVCGSTGLEPRCLAQEFMNTKAAYIVEAYATSFAQGLRTSVWYSLSGWRGSGLVGAQLNATPVYTAYSFAAQQFNQVTGIKGLDLGAGVKGYEMSKADGKLWVVWSADGDAHTINLPDMPRAAHDISGTAVSLAQTYAVTTMPLYVEW
jgi:hypothetical protein